MMTPALAIIVVVAALATSRNTTLPTGSLGDVRLSLSSDRPKYYVGEPLRLTLTVRNEGEDGIWGFFGVAVDSDEAQLQYRSTDGQFVPFALREDGGRPAYVHGERAPWVLRPGEERTAEAVVGVTGIPRRFLLDTPGEYELKLVCKPRRFPPGQIRLETEVIHITVDAVPSSEQSAFAEYRQYDLGLLVQVPLAFPDYDARTFQRAVAFVAQHRHSVYAQHVRRALVEALRFRVSQRKADHHTEVQLLDRLRSEVPER